MIRFSAFEALKSHADNSLTASVVIMFILKLITLMSAFFFSDTYISGPLAQLVRARDS